MNDIVVSIIIPLYNAENYIGACIKSILDQEMTDFEIIIIDDGSTDNGYQICADYAQDDSRVKLFKVPNGGPAKARNFALSKASGKYIEFVDSDDILLPGALMKLKKIADKTDAELLVASASILDVNDKIIRNISFDDDRCYEVADALKQMEIPEKEKYLHYIWNKWYLKELINKEHVSFDESLRLGEDFVFNCNVFSVVNKIMVSSSKLYGYYRRDNGSLSGKFNPQEIDRRRIVDGKYIELLSRYSLYETRKAKYDAQIGDVCLNSIIAVGLAGNSVSTAQKRSYIKTFVDSEYNQYIKTVDANSSKISIKKVLIMLLINNKIDRALWLINIYKIIIVVRRRLNDE